MNKAARLLSGISYAERITPVLISLHWLPIKARIFYKICCMVKSALLTEQPVYAKAHLIPTARGRLFVPRVKTLNGKRCFRFYGPVTFNTLPANLKRMEDFTKFKKHLKTHLFSLAYDLENNSINPDFKV